MQALEASSASATCDDNGAPLDEAAFRWQMACDGAANDKISAGIRSFAGDTARLVAILEAHPGWSS